MAGDTTLRAIEDAIRQKLGDAELDVRAGSAGHYTISVASRAFAGLSMLQSQRLVYGAIAHLMQGHDAPVHAVDSLKTRVP